MVQEPLPGRPASRSLHSSVEKSTPGKNHASAASLVVEAAGTILADSAVKPPQQIAVQRVAWTLIERKGEGAEAAIEDIQYIRKRIPQKVDN